MKKHIHIVVLSCLGFLTTQISLAQISSFPYSEDFESFSSCATGCGASCSLPGTSGWTNASGDNLDWIVDAGGTSSSNTGPTANSGADHNPGLSSGNYLYVESSCSGTGYPNKTANLLSPSIDLSGTNAIQFEFWYHMYGTSMGTMHLDISTDGGTSWSNDIIPSWTDNIDIWQQKTVSLAAYSGSVVSLRIRHITGTSFGSDAAIDDIKIFDLIQYDAGISAYISPTVPSCTFNDSVEVELSNYGTDTLTSVDIDWQWNQTSGAQVNWTGNLAPGTSTNVYLGSVPYTNGDTISAQTSMPNGVAEPPSGTMNDQSIISISTGLSGSYTIGSSGNYLTFNAAIGALDTIGVCGPVVFEVEDGTYNEQIKLIEVSGMSSINTVSFQGVNADPSLAILEYTGTGITDNFVVWVQGGDFYNFNNLTLSNPGTSYGHVLLIEDGATNNTWTNNIIQGALGTTSSSSNMALVYSPTGGPLDSMNVFNKNTFNNGSYSFYYYGNGNSGLESGTKIKNNTLNNFYYRGLNLYYQNNLEISGNTIIPDTLYTGSINRLNLSYVDGALRIYNNRIEGMNRGTGIYMSNCDALNTDHGYIYNNFIHVGDTASTSSSYGLFLTSCNNQKVTYNSVQIESNGSTSRAFYSSGGNHNHVFNNIFSNTGPGYGLYYNSGVVESDNNIIYVPNGMPFYSGGNISDIGTWQGLTSFDLASDTINPLFSSSNDFHTCQELSIDGAALADSVVLIDLDGQSRDQNNPDIGADEFLGITNLSFETDTIWKCISDSLKLGGWEPTDDASSYLWSTSDSSSIIYASTEGAYNVIITTACGTSNPSITVIDFPDAAAGFITNHSFMSVAFTSTSTGTIDTYLWDFGDGNTSSMANPTHLYADTGTYIVSLTVSGPCGSDVTTASIWSNTLEINEQNEFKSLTVYPSPNNGNFTIEFNLEQKAEVSFQLTDSRGSIIWASEKGILKDSYTENVQLNEIAEGIYFLMVRIGENTAVKKIVID